MSSMDYDKLADLGEQCMKQGQLDDAGGVARALAQMALRPDTTIIEESVATSVGRLVAAFISLQAAAGRMTAMNRDLQQSRSMLQSRLNHLEAGNRAYAEELLKLQRLHDTYVDECRELHRALDRYLKGGFGTKRDVQKHMDEAKAYRLRRDKMLNPQNDPVCEDCEDCGGCDAR